MVVVPVDSLGWPSIWQPLLSLLVHFPLAVDLKNFERGVQCFFSQKELFCGKT